MGTQYDTNCSFPILHFFFSGIPDLNYQVGTLEFKRVTLKPADHSQVCCNMIRAVLKI